MDRDDVGGLFGTNNEHQDGQAENESLGGGVMDYLSKKEEQPAPDDQSVECKESPTDKHVPGEVYGPSSIDGKFRRRCECCGKVVAT